jgi:methionyl aminopeptidase
MIIVKSPREIELMREAGRITASVFDALLPLLKPGVTTMELDQVAEKVIRSQNAIPGFKGYGGFPATLCISVNDVLVHGFPSKYRLKEGDIVSIDVGAVYKGYNGDAARTFAIGNVSEEASKLIRVTEECFWKAVALAKPGIYLSDISHAIQQHAEANGFSIPREYTGHGIGTELHEDPVIPNYGLPGHGPKLRVGMCLAIEPMLHQGKRDTKVMPDGWTVKTVDGKLASHYENTIVITEEGYEVLTLNGKH